MTPGFAGIGEPGSLYRRLLASNFAITTFAVVIFLICLAMNLGLQHQTQLLATVKVPASALTEQLTEAIEGTNTALRSWILLDDDAQLNRRRALWQHEIPQHAAALRGLCKSEQLAMLDVLTRQISQLEQSQRAVIDLFERSGARRAKAVALGVAVQVRASANWNQAISRLRGETEPIALEITALLQQIKHAHNDLLEESTQRLTVLVRMGTFALALGIITLSLFAWFSAHRNAKAVVTPIAELANASGQFARTLKMPLRSTVARPTEIAQLETSFDDMAVELGIQTRALQHANRELADYSHVITHDLKPPIINITGHAKQITIRLAELQAIVHANPDNPELLGRELQRLAHEEIPEAATYIDLSVKKLNALIGGVASSSKVVLRSVAVESVDTYAITAQVVALFSHRFRDVDIEVGELPVIETDAFLFEHVMSNLIDNALKFLDPNRSGSVRIAADKTSSGTQFRVVDNGRGITDSQVDIFGLFRRADTVTEGSGVGLALVRSMLAKLGGEIRFEPNPGRGVTFAFSIPERR